MARGALAIVAVVVWIGGCPARAADLPFKPLPASPADWTGFYAGVTAGAAWGSFDSRTSTSGGTNAGGFYLSPAQAATVTAAGTQRISPAGFEAGIEGGYNWQAGPFVLGVEADLEALHLNGAANSGGMPYPGAVLGVLGSQFVVSSYANGNWLLTVRPRVGYTVDNWLLYATGGLAVTHLNANLLFADSLGSFESGNVSATKTGYTVGAGVESRLSDRLSVKAEYLHVGFGNTAATITGNTIVPFFPNQAFSHSIDLSADIARVGLNYRFGPGRSGAYAMAGSGPSFGLTWLNRRNWEIETGSRVWFSTGTFGVQELDNNTLVSRLTYNDDAYSGEVFARVDHANGLFVKGFLGGGGITHGNMFDEDFPADAAYSRTLEDRNSGSVGYATIDIGYSLLKTADARVGPIIGYNYFRQQVSTFGCSQLAGDLHCTPADPFPPNFLGIGDDDRFQSLRIGLSTQFMLTDRLRLTADAAYVPWVTFNGLDDHDHRMLLVSDASNSGDGVMLEAILDYKVTDAWNVGIGGRYWALNMNTGPLTFDFLGGGSPNAVEPGRFNIERYGAFLQASYHWGDTSHAFDSGMPTKAPVLARAPMWWSGLYVGGHLGGGWGDDRWSDPFGSDFIPAGGGAANIAGFGDTTHATGPLGGGQIGLNFQIGNWVYGGELDATAAHLRGTNTCFSGIGGVNCTRNVNSLASITGRFGYAWNRALAYVKGGAALTDTTYALNANTGVLTLGTGNAGVSTWGWTIGGGVEYGLADHWTSFLEYDHIGIPSTSVTFPTVAVIGAQTIAVRQSIDLVRAGVNYRFDLATLGSMFSQR
ncbi:MAG TPA: outer membrane beta-barrel protein [Xanthobacteraceae bacterium]|nr:outer membrane beta-barrel protein [Xanthobacteraceae bacterium]